MLTRLFIALLVLSVLSPMLTSDARGGAAAAADEKSLRVMTFNIRNSHARDGDNAWPLRKDLFFSTIEAFKPDLLGMQEVLPDQAADARDRLKGYEFLGVGRDDGKAKGEFSPVMYRKDRFEKLGAGNFWLSETPDVPGSKSWDAALTRVCSWVKLKDRTNGRELLFFNTHWDHIGVKARVESGRLMRHKVEEIAGKDCPVIVTGDFNSPETTEQYKTMLGGDNDAVRLFDAYADAHPGEKTYTYNGFGEKKGGGRIDWILRSKHFSTVEAAVNRTHDGKRYPSDHYAVQAVLKWND